MDPHVIEMPRKIVVGNGVLEGTAQILGELKLSAPMLLADEKTMGVAGKAVLDSIHSMGPKTGTVMESSYAEADRLATKGVDSIVAVGGGKVIDMGKLVAQNLGVPMVSVPTAPSHDGIASERVSITHNGTKHSVKGEPPIAIIADVGILMEAPKRLTSAGCADTISNLTAVKDWQLGRNKGEYYSEYAASISLLAAEIVISSAELISMGEERGMRNLVEALISSGISMSMVSSSRPASGAEHMFSHALDNLCAGNGIEPPLHGESCGVGAVLMSCLQGGDWRRIRDALVKVGAPVTAGTLSVPKDMITEALLRAREIRKRYTVLDENPLDREGAEELCRKVGLF